MTTLTPRNKKTIELSDETISTIEMALYMSRDVSKEAEAECRALGCDLISEAEGWKLEHEKALAAIVEFNIAKRSA